MNRTGMACLWMALCLVVGTVRSEAEPKEKGRSTQTAFSLKRWTVDAGGTSGAGQASYVLAATIGQPEPAHAFGQGWTLVAGYWFPRRPQVDDRIFADDFEP